MSWSVYQADCIEFLKRSYGTEFDSVVTDPPYALDFMGKSWDSFGNGYQSWCQEWAAECLRVIKPGGYLLAFGGTRTYHRLASAIEDAGFEIRDSLSWIYGSGFPKSLDVSKAIDKTAGAEREPGKPGRYASRRPREDVDAVSAYHDGVGDAGSALVTAPATEAAKQWQGWGTALKPAHEPIVMARKPFKSTVASNVLEHGTGGINIDGCRIGGPWTNPSVGQGAGRDTANANGPAYRKGLGGVVAEAHKDGRWPANIILSHSPACGVKCAAGCPVAEVDRQSGISKSSGGVNGGKLGVRIYGEFKNQTIGQNAGGLGDIGGASRFFYHAKAGKKERPTAGGIAHPTVKPVDLIRWLVRLVTPPGGYVLDPFAGTGTTAEACELEGFDCLLIERERDYVRLISQRMSSYQDKAA